MTSIDEPTIVIAPPRRGPTLGIAELWASRDLFLLLIWRDIKVRYKQTVLGVLWAILQPVLTMVVFSVVFGRLAHLPSDGKPYPVFTFVALLPWQLFSYALTSASNSLVSSQHLIKKVYFPRLIVPFASIGSGLADFGIALIILIPMLFFYGIHLTWHVLALPLFILFALVAALAVGLWLSALNVEYRDVQYTIPFLTQLWMFATPIAYSSSIIPAKWRTVYAANPLVGVIEGFRWSLLGTGSLNIKALAVSGAIVSILFVGGIYYFRRMERTFADVV